MEKLFVYGTLRNPSTRKMIVGRKVNSTPAILNGYKRSRIKIKDKPYSIIIPSRENFVRGLILEVTNRELKKIDNYEFKFYKRKKVKLNNGKNGWAYVKNR